MVSCSSVAAPLGIAAAAFCAAKLLGRRSVASQTAQRPFAVQAAGEGIERGLVSCEWLKAELERAKEPLRLVDATYYLPNSPFAAPAGSKGPEGDFLAGPRIPGSVFFDLDGVASPHPEGLKHMLPSEETFAAAMAAMGIEPTTRVVVYDRHGIFSAPRFWYTLKVAFQHPAEVAVLDGGLPRWQELGYPLESGTPSVPPSAPTSKWKLRPSSVWAIEEVIANMKSHKALVLDARSAGRFYGEAPEPRAGMRGGHIPGSLSVPFTDLLTGGPARKFLPPAELANAITKAGLSESQIQAADGQALVTSCGSGLTACVVGLAMHQVGMPLDRWAVYDGSWAEWAAREDTPVLKRGPDGKLVEVP